MRYAPLIRKILLIPFWLQSRENSVFQLEDSIASPGKRHIVRAENRRKLMRSMQAFQKMENHFAGPEIQVAGRFVREQYGRPSHQGAFKDHPSLLTDRQFPRNVRN